MWDEKEIKKLAGADTVRCEKLEADKKRIEKELEQAIKDRDTSHALLWRIRHDRNMPS